MLKGGAEFLKQKGTEQSYQQLRKEFLRTTDIGSARIRQVACTGIYGQHSLGVGMYASAPRG
jgi:hypothetical protein